MPSLIDKARNQRRKNGHKRLHLPEWEWLQDSIAWVKAKNDDEGRKPFSTRKTPARQLESDKRISLKLEAIGRLGSYFFLTESSNYLKRHVETLQIKSASYARRRLTIDVQLPIDPSLGRFEQNGVYEFWLPVTFLAKWPSRSNVDVRDDHGRAVPLLTRSESNEISIAAALAAAETILGRESSPFLEALFKELIKCDGMQGEVPLLMVKRALEEEGADFDHLEVTTLFETLRTLSGNYSMWVGFHGRPGERRIVKLHYDVEFDRQGILRQWSTTRECLVFGKQTGTEIELDLEERGDKNPYLPPRRIFARGASSTGLGAVNVGIESPYLAGSDSYHLQVESPPGGVEARDLDLLATVDEEEGDARSWSRDHGVHLYVSRARLTEESAGLAILTLRIGRRGFMTLSWISALVSAMTLWLFDLTANYPLESPEASAAVLLFGPALLAAMVVRPGEHPLTTKLFAGVRLLVALNGILVVAGAAAVAGVRPEGWTVEHMWFILAILASGGAAIVSLSWLFSWEMSYQIVKWVRRRLAKPRSYRRLCAEILAFATGILVLGPTLPSFPWIVVLLLLTLAAIAVACGFVAAGYAGMKSSVRLAAVSVTATGLALVAAGAVLVMKVTTDWTWEIWWLVLSLVPLGFLIALWVNNQRYRRKKNKGVAAEPSPGERILLRVLQPTPSGKLVQEQARANATGIPDLIAPSAYREVPQPKDLIEDGEAEHLYESLRQAWIARELYPGSEDGQPVEEEESAPSADEGDEAEDPVKAAEDRAKSAGREFVGVNL